MKALHIVKDNKKASGGNDKKVFGAVLDQSCTTIPTIVEACVVYLDAMGLELEGVFRKSGSLAQMKEYRNKFDNGESVDFSDVTDPHIVAGLLKLYIREYPEPLLTFELYDCFLAAVAIPDVSVKVPKVKQVISMLPAANLMIVRYLVAFLCRVSAKAQVNFMTPSNLAIVFAPNLLRPPYEGDEGIGIMMEDTPFANQLLQLFINHFDALFSDSAPPSNTITKPIPVKPTPPKKPPSVLSRPGSTVLPPLPPPPSIPLPALPPSNPPSNQSVSDSSPPPRPSTPPPKPPSVLSRSANHPLPVPPSSAPSLPPVVETKTTPLPPPKPASVHVNSPSPPSSNLPSPSSSAPTNPFAPLPLKRNPSPPSTASNPFDDEPPVISPRSPLPPTPVPHADTPINDPNYPTTLNPFAPTPTPPPKPSLASNPNRKSTKPLPTAPARSPSVGDVSKQLPSAPILTGAK